MTNPNDPDLARFLADELGVDAPATDIRNWVTRGPVWIWRGNGNGPPPKAAWYFLTISGEVAQAIRAGAGQRRGFGSVRVTATIGATSWQTSLFPAKELGGYLLPLKATVRKAEGLEADTEADVTLTLVDR
ncbi:MAG: DUF1905 domain-containing protein [Pseudomonadota bacterium]